MKTVEIHELTERINEILHLLQDKGESIEVTNQGKIIGCLVPANRPKQPAVREHSEAWKNLERLSYEIGAHWPDNVTAVDAVRDIRREL